MSAQHFSFFQCFHTSLFISLLTTVFARSCFLSSIDRIFFVCLFFHNNIISNNRNNYFRIPSVCVLYVCRRVCLSWFLDFGCLLKFCEHRAPWSIWWGWCKSTRLNINEFITANGHFFCFVCFAEFCFGRLNYISTNCSRYMLPRVCKSSFFSAHSRQKRITIMSFFRSESDQFTPCVGGIFCVVSQFFLPDTRLSTCYWMSACRAVWMSV